MVVTPGDARHHVQVGRQTFCTVEWVERPDEHCNVAVVRCPHHVDPLRWVRVRPTCRAVYLKDQHAGAVNGPR